MTHRVTVVAIGGRVVPMEGVPGSIGAEPCEVNDSHYYRCRITAGELRVVEAIVPTEPTTGPQAGDADPAPTVTRRAPR